MKKTEGRKSRETVAHGSSYFSVGKGMGGGVLEWEGDIDISYLD
jgi:hypothetical protein